MFPVTSSTGPQNEKLQGSCLPASIVAANDLSLGLDFSGKREIPKISPGTNIRQQSSALITRTRLLDDQAG